jgi:hypothetical protein
MGEAQSRRRHPKLRGWARKSFDLSAPTPLIRTNWQSIQRYKPRDLRPPGIAALRRKRSPHGWQTQPKDADTPGD